ncbi:putative bifunctional diguanylate cyclase/phosphodiesterase [sulfur-oxidizing endosymbiont of Gigantopelta aegis]|uniref:putative bifunctional diguanylate cyclase/phosphodiesterase n=1 Tax=sulfur-oxidizing endosymbiont of Gigantopelta aegis TaxID=2794934 RepID=UPI0018DB88ED|nr:EAL domain-containing protein [sulfur-oxidizing endosymbiont of Gigantopelta aegis]
MWQKFSIRSQLIILIAILLIVIELGIFLLLTWFDHQERRSIAVAQASTLGRSLNNDLLKALLSPEADIYADIAFRISGFKSVDALVLFDQDNQAILSHGVLDYTRELQGKKLLMGQSWFSKQDRLFLKLPVQADDYTYGQTLIVINPKQYQTGLKEHLYTLLFIFPALLAIGLLLAWKISLIFTRPFRQLDHAMTHYDVHKQENQNISTDAKNEVRSLFDGFNNMIEQIKEKTNKLDYRSRHDYLTGLLNRYAIEQEIEQVLRPDINTSPSHHALLSIDLDQFKLVNDSVGHIAGDEVLKKIALILQNDIPDNIVIARVGGDDFFLLIKNTSEDEAIQFAKQQLKRLKSVHFKHEENTITLSASIGMVIFEPFEYTLEELIKTVDIAFYNAKATGHNKLHIYNEQNKNNHDLAIAGYIKEALQNGPSRFELYAQAIVPLQDTNTHKISYEVLIRMWNGQGEFMPPDSFLAIAERYNMMVDIDIFVLKTFLASVMQQPEHVKKLHSAHINLAGGTLNDPDFQTELKKTIEQVDFPWQCLELEITETSAIGNLSQASELISFCHSKKIGFALDDFGTGMASFDYLKNLPFNVVKIDGSFVRDMLTNDFDKLMIRHTQEICQLNNQETVAEYVETQEDVDTLTKMGITYGQGYHLGKPKPLNDWF